MKTANTTTTTTLKLPYNVYMVRGYYNGKQLDIRTMNDDDEGLYDTVPRIITNSINLQLQMYKLHYKKYKLLDIPNRHFPLYKHKYNVNNDYITDMMEIITLPYEPILDKMLNKKIKCGVLSGKIEYFIEPIYLFFNEDDDEEEDK